MTPPKFKEFDDFWREFLFVFAPESFTAKHEEKAKAFLKANFIAKSEIKEAIKKVLGDVVHGDFCEDLDEKFKKCCACKITDLKSTLKL